MSDPSNPWNTTPLPLWTSDFLSGTAEMTSTELGCYIRLLCYQWLNGSVPSDPSLAARITNSRPATARKVISSKFELRGGRATNLRLESARDEIIKTRRQASKRAKIAADARWGNECSEHASSNPEAMLTQCPPTPTPKEANASIPSESQIRGKGGGAPDKRAEKGISRSFLSWAVSEVWKDHLEHWRRFYRRANGVAPSPEPDLDAYSDLIRKAILRHDRRLVMLAERERFVTESRARAAGIGIFYDEWCTGQDPENDVLNGGRRYLEHWRPWKPQRGKGDPVDRFADLYFEMRSLQHTMDEN